MYIITGYLFKRVGIERQAKWKFVLLGTIAFILTVVEQLFSYRHNILYTVWYNNALIAIVGICVFGMVSGLDFKKWNRSINFISKHSFGVFLIHNPINMILIEHILLNPELFMTQL